MSTKYGLKIGKSGFDVTKTDIRGLQYTSEFQTLKIYKKGIVQITNSNRSFTIDHGLGYPPVFTILWQPDHLSQNSTNFISSPNTYYLAPQSNYPHNVTAKSDIQVLTIAADSLYGTDRISVQSGLNVNTCFAYEYSGFGGAYNTGLWSVGRDTGGLEVLKGAMRFGNVLIDQGTTIASATINIIASSRTGSGNILLKCYGINEDNTVTFNTGTAATARSKTTANVTNTSNISAGSSFNFDVTALVQEVINRAGWVSGNVIGFIMDDNGTSGVNYYTTSDIDNNFLDIVISNTMGKVKYTIFSNPITIGP